MANTPPPPEEASRRPNDDVPRAEPNVGPLPPPTQESGVNMHDEDPSVPVNADGSHERQNLAFPERNVVEPGPFFEHRLLPRPHVDEPNVVIEHTYSAEITYVQPGPSQTTSNAHVNAKRNVHRSSFVPEKSVTNGSHSVQGIASGTPERSDAAPRQLTRKRKWNDGVTPSLDPPEIRQPAPQSPPQQPIQIQQPQQQQLFELQPPQPQLPFEEEFREPVNEQNENEANGNAIYSNYLFISTTHYVSRRRIPFELHGRFFEGHINATGFLHVPTVILYTEMHMEFISETFVMNQTDEILHFASGVIVFPGLINQEAFIIWYHGNYICFQGMLL